jgi:SAM-dependent methyltransferase
VIDDGDIESVVSRPTTHTATQYSYAEIKRALERDNDRYHRVELPYGLHARGQDVWQRFPLIFPRDLTGWSVLDIGCAHGAFAFEAERRGARVTGCDINPKRLEVARQLGDLLGSSVTFNSVDYLSEKQSRESENGIDLVLALNVLHHVPEPEQALLALSRLAARRVVLEFPTSQDPLYQATPMRRTVGPYLVECLSLFTEVRLVQSHKEGRVIAVCFTRPAPEGGTLSRDGASRRGTPRHEQLSLQPSSTSTSTSAVRRLQSTPRSMFRSLLDRIRSVLRT